MPVSASNRPAPKATKKSQSAAPRRAAPRSASKPRKPPMAGVVARLMVNHSADVWGITATVGAMLSAMAIYTDTIGPVGRGVDWLAGAVVGIGRGFLPLMLGLVAVAQFNSRRSEYPARIAVGSGLVTVAVLGLVHIVRGPLFGTPMDEIRSAGGLVGLIFGRPLQAALADAGAAMVLAAIGLVGVLIATKASMRTIAQGAARGLVPAGRVAKRAYADLSTLTSERLGTTPELYDIPLEGPDDDPADKSPPTLSPPARAALPATPGPGVQPELELGPGAKRGAWRLPAANLLERTQTEAVDMVAVRERGEALMSSLASHGVGTKLVGQTVGPTVTRFELELDEGVKVARVTSLNRDIAYAMAATDVRILAPIPGRKAIGIEVPNTRRQLVALGDLLSSKESKAATHPLEVGIGKDIAGRSVFLNLGTTPHLLIAGATGAGKSSGINCIITSLLMRTTPDQVKLILIDPKQVEMGQYARLPHLLTQPVTNPKKAANALAWAVREMERRYDVLYEVGYRDIGGYNAAFDRGELEAESGREAVFERLPYIVVVVDELNDLMMVAARDVEDSVTRIAQKARAVGIHLIIATQRPSVNVITGVIKANVPARMAFAVSSLTDSRVILDQAGAEKLVGKGDLLLLPGNSSVAQRIQGAWVSEEEVRKVAAHWRRQAPEPVYVTGVEGDTAAAEGVTVSTTDDDDDETLVRAAMELIVRSQLGSTSMLQRKLKVGFARAGRIMDLLEQRGVVGPSEGSKARSVLMTVEEFELMARAERT